MTRDPDLIWELRFRSWLYSHISDRTLSLSGEDAHLFKESLMHSGSPGYFLARTLDSIFEHEGQELLFMFREAYDRDYTLITEVRSSGSIVQWLKNALRYIEKRFAERFKLGDNPEWRCEHLVFNEAEEDWHVGAWELHVVATSGDHREIYHCVTGVEQDPCKEDDCPVTQYTYLCIAESIEEILKDLRNSDKETLRNCVKP